MWRKTLIAIAFIACFAFIFLWQFLLLVSGLFVGVLLLLCVILLIYLLTTSPRQRKGIEQFIFTHTFFAQCAMTQDEQVDALVYDWQQVNRVELRRISSVWCRLKLGWSNKPGGRIARTVLDLGFRCDSQSADDIIAYLQEQVDASLGMH